MDKMPSRYNSGIQRSKGLLEIAAALYDTSLSRQSTRSGTRTPQIDSRLGTQLSLHIAARKDAPADRDVSVSFGVGGSRRNLVRVAEKELSLLWINPNAPLALAYKGCPPFSAPLPLRTIAVFPSWDAGVIAVHESTGITSIEQIRERRYPLRVSTGNVIVPPFDDDPTMFAIATVMAAAGFSFADLLAWGGAVHTVSRPSHPERAAMIDQGAIDAVFDEGIMSWGQYALERGFRILPLEGGLRDRVAAAGYDVMTVTQDRLPALRQPVPSVDFCGWPMIVHRDMSDELAYALCEAIEARKLVIPTDNYRPVSMMQLSSPDEETPRGAPLHPGAERFYRERGYLRP
ncbi:MAG TPA: TAXI family TRAP transporter solute-binding subunit [Stellaceae bacterium]|nr:TAXI family TRAP transporter solute-binding subunit [Stellaceae bacterium]